MKGCLSTKCRSLLFVVFMFCYFKLSVVGAIPTSYYEGAQPRPILSIIKPEHGQILETGDVDVEISIFGYEFPSLFHSSAICLSLSTGSFMQEQCFDQSTSSFTFHATGLSPGSTYSLRIVLYERGHAIAVSLRSFHVGGVANIASVDKSKVIIKTAVELAVQYQLQGMEREAELMYREILSEYPNHAEALHLLGIVFYQRGEPQSAIAYIEQAISGNHKQRQGFHASLGECYRKVGRLDDAVHQFKLELALNPNQNVAKYNLAVTYQQLFAWDNAIDLYQAIFHSDKLDENGDPIVANEDLRLLSKIRHCDLFQLRNSSIDDAIACWLDGLEHFQQDPRILNELGVLFAKISDYHSSSHYFQLAIDQGSFIAQLNAAHVFELRGLEEESKAAYQTALTRIRSENHLFCSELLGYSSHVRIRLATLLPRIPRSTSHIKASKDRINNMLRELVISSETSDFLAIDNSQPLAFGFSTGYFFLFMLPFNIETTPKTTNMIDTSFSKSYTIESNLELMRSLSILYLKFCPSLSSGVFMDRKNLSTQLPTGYIEDSTSLNSNNGSNLSAIGSEQRLLHIGIISSNFYSREVGVFALGLIQLFQDIRNQGIHHIEVTLFVVNSFLAIEDGILWSQLSTAVDAIIYLSNDIEANVNRLRQERLDLLLYTDILADSLSYFTAFARAAPVQASLHWGHPDTSGIDSVDYFLGYSGELPAVVSKSYSEQHVAMHHFGCYFPDFYSNQTIAILQDAKHASLERAKVFDILGIMDRSAHFYVITSPLYAYHIEFDYVLRAILTQDRLAYIVFVIFTPSHRSNSPNRSSCRMNNNTTGSNSSSTQYCKKTPMDIQSLFSARLFAGMTEEAKRRVLFYYPKSIDRAIRVIASAHIMLDPFPVGNLHSVFQGLSLGIPVISLPSHHLAGRYALGLYKMMNMDTLTSKSIHSNTGSITSLIVDTVSEYVSVAVGLAHKPQLRDEISRELLHRKKMLFDRHNQESKQLRVDWIRFIQTTTSR